MKNRNAFTMIELLLVVTLIAIIASYSMPRLKRDTRSEAINHMLSMIRYTQNLALHDSKHSISNTKWQRSFWRFQLYFCKGSKDMFYLIGTDNDLSGKVNYTSEAAVDPSNNKPLFWTTAKTCPKNSADALTNQVSPNIFISQKYGIKKVTFNSCNIRKNGSATSSAKHIGFDNFGRPLKSYTQSLYPNYWGHTVGNCTIKFEFKDSTIKAFTIVVPPESGYAYLQENPKL
jgi:prepilin-type N-terminal cleavage/methylation domain-containing protein